jgi:hypothetical protein
VFQVHLHVRFPIKQVRFMEENGFFFLNQRASFSNSGGNDSLGTCLKVQTPNIDFFAERLELFILTMSQ